MSDQTTPSAGSADMKQCPICAEQVKGAALICRFCGHDFRTDAAAASAGPPASGAPSAGAPWQAPAPAPGQPAQDWGAWTPAAAAPGQIPTTAPQDPGWGQWAGAPGVQTAGSLPGPATVPGMGYPVAPSRATNGYAVASMVLGILWVWWIGSALALIFGYVAKNQIDRSNGMETGRGMALAGIILGWVGVGFLVLGIIGFIAGRTHGGY
jgi:Domain of unknown function (DUF4190)/Uncharacterised protein family UPF0547